LISIDLSAISKPNEILTIKGENLNSDIHFSEIYITYPLGTYMLHGDEMLKISQNEIKIKLNDSFFVNLLSSLICESKLEVRNFQFTTNLITVPINYISTWTKKKDFPGVTRTGAVAFSLNNKGYVGTGVQSGTTNYLNDFWEYDPALDEWTRIEDFPGNPRSNALAFVINNIAYVGFGTDQYSENPDYWNMKDFYSYNAQTGHWTRVADFPGIGRFSSSGFSINNKGYIVGGWCATTEPYSRLGSDFWEYDPIANLWQQLPDFPKEIAQSVGFNIGNDGYIYDYNVLYKYDGNSWAIKNSPLLSSQDMIAFSISGLGYFGLGDYVVDGPSDFLYEYNPLTGTSINRPIPVPRRQSVVFTINNKAYVVGGSGKGSAIYLGDVWEFDPTKPQQ
jgi:N-acetylneuraminic acid mutarotase